MIKFLVYFLLSFLASITFAKPKYTTIKISADSLGYELSSKGLTLQVASSGCLDKSYFSIRHVTDLTPPHIFIDQEKKDFCESEMPYGTKITFSYSELDIKDGQWVQVRIGPTLIIPINF